MERVSAAPRAFVGHLRETAEMIKIEHTVFALPFAAIALVTAAGRSWPAPRVWLWVLVAMVAARTAAMTFNRLADHRIDAANPRTSGRALPAGRLGRPFAWAVTSLSVATLVLAAGMLNRTCLLLSPVAVAVLLGYSFAKRFTTWSHLWLGLSLGMAPAGAWLAVTGRLAPAPLVLGAAVTLWVAGFDIIYSLQDQAFDRANGLFSAPARLGVGRALWLARGAHLLALAGFLVFAAAAGGGVLRAAAVVAAAGLLVWQHRLVAPRDLSRVNAAFFTTNGILSILMCVLFVLAKLTAGP
ncbi:MAG: putative 4-hydroxybenzoate polyprenyltransferase [Acidobacteria bacterium]|nr:putative 4-hydroxybenzoate polyprenyltransferase [Acidobacteriota bacterium]